MGAIRKKLLDTEHAPEAHKPLFESLIQKNLLEMIQHNEKDRINQTLLEVLGPGFDFEALIADALDMGLANTVKAYLDILRKS